MLAESGSCTSVMLSPAALQSKVTLCQHNALHAMYAFSGRFHHSAVHAVCRLQAIQRTGELRRMARTHIHFATEARHMRVNAWATVLLKLDLSKALQEGYKFHQSSNGVILAEGPIPVKLLTPVTKDDLLGKR